MAWRLREVDGLVAAIAAAVGRRSPDASRARRERAVLRASADAFGQALILLEEDGPHLAAGEETLERCARALAGPGDGPEAILSAIGRLDAAGGRALADLQAAGVTCLFTVRAPGGMIHVQGRTSGALALVSLSITEVSPQRPEVALGARSLAAALARQAEGQSMILNAVADAVALFGPDRRLTYHNGAFARLLGLAPAWLAEGPSHAALLDRLRQEGRLPEAADYGLFKTQELGRHERLDAAPEATWRVAGERTLRVVSLPHPAGGLILVFSDITPEVRLSGQFNHQIQVQQATLDKLTDAVAVFGADGRLKLHNEAFQVLWAIPAPALAGRPLFDDIVERCVPRLHDLSFWRDLKGRITDLDPGVRAAVRGEALTADGRRLAWQSRPLPDGATLVSFVDVTDTRRLEGALRDREAALDATERLKRDFVSSVSHELRTPLTTILGYAELLERGDEGLSERGRRWVEAVRSAGVDLARSVEDILAFAELDAGEMTLKLGETDVSALLVEATTRWRRRASDGGVALDLELADDPGDLIADAVSLARVLDHLIEQALRQTPAGGRVTVSARRAFGEVCLQVSDTGRGIPFHVQARIFDRFSGEEGAGTGLGLALVKALVELHGGWVAVESAPGAGATFACHLPEAGQAQAETPLPLF